MSRKDKLGKLPIFPDSYIGEEAENYNNQRWMERNQKRTTLKCIEYLFDEKLGKVENFAQNTKSNMVIDLGCGTGFSSEILIENGFHVIGIDILKDMIIKAKERKKHLKDFELILADIKYLPIRKNSINYIISVSAYNFVIHEVFNIREKQKILKSTAIYLREILKPQSRLIIEFYPENDGELDLFSKSFVENGFKGFYIKNKSNQKSGQTFLLLKNMVK